LKRARTVSVAVTFNDGSPAVAPVECAAPVSWTEDDAKTFLYSLYYILGAHGIHALEVIEVGLGLRLEVWADSGHLTTPVLETSNAAHLWLRSVAFRLPV
jgi:hypothetical protein